MIRLPDRTVPEWLMVDALVRGRGDSNGDELAVEVAGRPLTYSELDRLSNQAAANLAALGVKKVKPDDKNYLFPSRKGNGPLKNQAVSKLIKKWTSSINLKGNFGCHTLRKTFGYIQRVDFGVGFDVLCKRFNHSSPSITMRYLGIQDKEVNGILMNDI